MVTSVRPVTTSTDLQALVKREAENAADFIELEIGHERGESIEYYRGERFGNEEDGRSQVVWRTVRDAVRQILPSLMKVFFGSERAVEYMPRGPEDVEAAEQATDYANYVILQDNPGVRVFMDVFNDSLYQKMGVVKLWRDESVEITYHDFTDLDEASVALVLMEEGTEMTKMSERLADPNRAGEFMAQGIEPPKLYDITVKRTRTEPRIRIEAVPPEEFLIHRRARTIEDSVYVAHRTLKTVDELVRMGYDRDMLEEHIYHSDWLLESEETYQRWEQLGGLLNDDTMNPNAQRVLYVEHWLRVDLDGPPDETGNPTGDGYAELRKICTVGEGYEIVNGDGYGEPASEIPFAAFCPFPEPHIFFGQDVADQTKDLQLIQSQLMRLTLDSLAQSIHPRMAVVEDKVVMDDVLNTEMGGVVRMDAPGMVQPLIMPFIGKEAMPVQRMVQDEADRRVGVHDMALEADALQSTTKAAVNAQVQAARQQLELIARIYAEIGMKRFFRLLLKLIVSHQDKKRTVRLRNEWVTVDPSTWNANMDVTVNVGLGYGLEEERAAVLREVLQIQREALQTLGPSNPVAGFGHLTNTLKKLLEFAGIKDTGRYFKDVPTDWEPPPQPPKQDPAEMLAEVERQKIMADMANDAAELDLERDKMHADVLLEAAKIEAEYNKAVDVAEIRRAIEQNKLDRQGESE